MEGPVPWNLSFTFMLESQAGIYVRNAVYLSRVYKFTVERVLKRNVVSLTERTKLRIYRLYPYNSTVRRRTVRWIRNASISKRKVASFIF